MQCRPTIENSDCWFELSLKEHKQRSRELDRKSEALDRKRRQLNLIVYNVQETAEEDDQGMEHFFHSWTSVCQMAAIVKVVIATKYGWVYTAQIRRGHVRYV